MYPQLPPGSLGASSHKKHHKKKSRKAKHTVVEHQTFLAPPIADGHAAMEGSEEVIEMIDQSEGMM